MYNLFVRVYLILIYTTNLTYFRFLVQCEKVVKCDRLKTGCAVCGGRGEGCHFLLCIDCYSSGGGVGHAPYLSTKRCIIFTWPASTPQSAPVRRVHQIWYGVSYAFACFCFTAVDCCN